MRGRSLPRTLLSCLLVACAAPDPSEGPAFSGEPELVRVSPDVPQARELRFTTEAPATAVVRWSDGALAGTVELPEARSHVVPILRVRPDREVTVQVELHDGHSTTLRQLSFRSDPLPDPFPDVVVHTRVPERMSPGDTLVGVVSADAGAYQVVLSPDGEVLWWWRRDPRILELQLRSDGTLLGNEKGGGLVTVDWLGRITRRWSPSARALPSDVPVDVPIFHHDAQRLPDGTLLGLTSRTVWVPDFPISYVSPDIRRGSWVRDDAVVVMADDGVVLREIPYSSAIPTDRIGYTSLVGSPYDWVHGNGVAVAPDVDALLVSSRAQDALVAYELDGSPRWILANPANWDARGESLRLQPVGEPFSWPYKQHAPEWSEGGRVMVFDNGNRRASPWTDDVDLDATETWSRIVEYEVDEQARTVAMAWEFEIPGVRLFGDYMGDADHLPGGTVLADFAGVIVMDGRYLADYGLGKHMIRLAEFVPESGELVWDVELSSPIEEVADGWNSYRAQRLPLGWETGAVTDLP